MTNKDEQYVNLRVPVDEYELLEDIFRQQGYIGYHQIMEEFQSYKQNAQDHEAEVRREVLEPIAKHLDIFGGADIAKIQNSLDNGLDKARAIVQSKRLSGCYGDNYITKEELHDLVTDTCQKFTDQLKEGK